VRPVFITQRQGESEACAGERNLIGTQLTVLLAGGRTGQPAWVGRDKGLMPWQGQPIAKHSVDMVRPLACEV